jgi:hypothetical protein
MRTYPGWSRLMVVAKASRTGTGRAQPRCAVMGKWRYSQPPPCYRLGYCTASRRLFIGKSCGRRLVRYDGIPNSIYNEYSCYTNVPLCQ